jgi:parallel beta-helix repeat protein
MLRRLTLLVLSFVLIANFAQATNYYFSSVSGDDSRTPQQAANPLTPWKTLDKLTAYNLSIKPGDSVLFKRGESFFGTLTIKSSGISGNNVYYGAYGVGANPLISGFVTLTNWTLYSGNIYYTSLDVPSLNIVTMNGTAKSMGRWPNTGWLKVDSHVGNQSITSSGLTSGTNWSGGEIVMRKYRFILDRHTITSQSGTTLNYSTSTANGNNTAFTPVDKNGFFIQNHLSTLDQQGEWYYDPAAKRLYMHFGGSSPSSFVVKAAAKDFNTFVTTTNFLKIENIDFEGGNNKGLWLTSSSNVLIQDCNFSNEGGSSVYAVDVSWITMKGGTVNTSFSNGVNFENNANNCTVDGVSVSNTNMIPGTGRSGSGVSDGITISGNNSTITNNRVVNTGFNGINFLGNNVLVEKNYVDTFCTIKDDGGGIYTYVGGSNSTYSNRKVRNNIILNAIGAQAGTDAYSYEAFGKGAGIYLDEYVNNVEISGNTIANGDWAGIFMHNAHDCQISNNIIYNHRYQMHVSQYTAATRNMTETGNQYISKQAFQEVWYYRTFVADAPSTMGTSNSNYFARPIDDNKTIHCDFYQSGGAGTQYYTLDQWKSYFSLDGSSLKSPITYKANIADSIRFETNPSSVVKVVSLDASYLDVKGNQYAGTLTLQPFTSVVLLKSRSSYKLSQVITFPGISDKLFGISPFALTAITSSGLPVSYRVVSGPATISNNMVTLTGVGTVTIEASQAGNTTYNAAPVVTQSFSITAATTTKQNQTITFPAIANKTYGDAPFALAATASSGLSISYRVVSGPATVSGNTVTLTGTGTVTIEASQTGNTTYNAATPVQQSFTVQAPSTTTTKQSQTITFPAIPNKTFGDAPFTLTATASSGLPVSYRVISGPATVSGNVVTITGTGEVWIEASQSGNAYYDWANLTSQNFFVSAATTVTKSAQTITFPAIADKTYGDPTFALAATASSGLPVLYRVVSGPATISGNTVTLTGVGTVTIEASQAGDANYNVATPVQQSFDVLSATRTGTGTASQTITFGTLSYKTFGAAPFKISATASSGLSVSFRVVSGPATISGNTVTITGVGLVTIEASQTGNTTYSAADPVQRSFTVGKAGQSISFPTPTNKVYGAAPFALTATASSGLTVNYRVVSGPAKVSGSTVTLTGTGTVTIEASQPGNTNYNAAYALQRSFTVTAPATATVAATTAQRTQPLMETTTVTSSTIGVYPNPVVNSANIAITPAQSFTGTVDIIDMQGRLVQRFSDKVFEKGQITTLSLDAGRMISGIYIVRLSSQQGIVSKQFQVTK